ncbi:hypothetical protein CVT24_001925, partial [Panaeolus cyanescens]
MFSKSILSLTSIAAQQTHNTELDTNFPPLPTLPKPKADSTTKALVDKKTDKDLATRRAQAELASKKKDLLNKNAARARGKKKEMEVDEQNADAGAEEDVDMDDEVDGDGDSVPPHPSHELAHQQPPSLPPPLAMSTQHLTFSNPKDITTAPSTHGNLPPLPIEEHDNNKEQAESVPEKELEYVSEEEQSVWGGTPTPSQIEAMDIEETIERAMKKGKEVDPEEKAGQRAALHPLEGQAGPAPPERNDRSTHPIPPTIPPNAPPLNPA